MTVFPFPTEALQNSTPFFIVGRSWESGLPEGELLVIPTGSDVPAGFSGPLWSPEPIPDRPGLLYPPSAGRANRPVAFPAFFPRRTRREQFSRAAAQFGPRLWLHLDALSSVYTLPCPDGRGKPLSGAQQTALLAAHHAYFCPEFLCQCAHWPENGQIQVLLFDTPETLQQVLALAAAVQIPYVFGRFSLEGLRFGAALA